MVGITAVSHLKQRQTAGTQAEERADLLAAPIPGAPEPGGTAAAAHLDAAGRLAHLQSVLARGEEADASPEGLSAVETWRKRYAPPPQEVPPADEPAADAADATPRPVRSWSMSPFIRRVLKTALGLAIVAIVGYAPLQRLLQTSSVEAVVNARTITLRAPIDGVVQAGPSPLDFGRSIAGGELLFRIVNTRADRSRVDDLSRQLAQLKDERPGIADRLATARTLFKDLTEQTRLFAAGRILQLEARQGELHATLAAAAARSEEASANLERITALAANGWTTTAQLGQAQRDASVAKETAGAAQKRLEAGNVELDAARRGVFVGDSYNDRPRSSQRADELQQLVSELTATLSDRDQRIVRLTGELTEEKARYADLAATDMVAPAKGSVWEVLTAPGEQVHRGQDLLRVLDCGGALVTAVVSESVYNGLRVGSPARFRPRDGHMDLPGRVIRLTGASASPANLAIQPSVLMRESYHVTVAVPALADGTGCTVGRTGRVIFDDGPVEAAAVQAPPAP